MVALFIEQSVGFELSSISKIRHKGNESEKGKNAFSRRSQETTMLSRMFTMIHKDLIENKIIL